MLSHETSFQSSNPRRHPTCWASPQWSHTISRAPCHGAWTSTPLSAHPSIECCCHKSRHPFAPAAQQLISSSDNNIRAAQWADHQWNVEWADNPTRLRTLILDTGTHPPEWSFQEEPESGLTASAPASDVSAPACTDGIWPPLRPVSVAQKNKLSTVLSSNVQSIDLPTDYTAWRFWTMR